MEHAEEAEDGDSWRVKEMDEAGGKNSAELRTAISASQGGSWLGS